jgi:hypothetical protein
MRFPDVEARVCSALLGSFDFLKAFALVFCPIHALRYLSFWTHAAGATRPFTPHGWALAGILLKYDPGMKTKQLESGLTGLEPNSTHTTSTKEVSWEVGLVARWNFQLVSGMSVGIGLWSCRCLVT